MSWALSCLQLKKYHDKITLHSDSNVANMFIDILRLPYSNVISDLDKLNKYNSQLWAIPKIYVYSVQDTPFINIDGDVYIWEPFKNEFFKQSLIVQNLETDEFYYRCQLEVILNKFSFIPSELLTVFEKNGKIRSYNAGIFGGSDIQFIKEYTRTALEFVEKNTLNLDKVNLHAFNTIYEQYLFYCLTELNNKKVSAFISGTIDDLRYPGFADFLEVPYNKKYLHLHGLYKKNEIICRQLANRLRNDYPEYYYRIINLFKINNLSITNDAYYLEDSISENSLVNRFYFLKNKNNVLNTKYRKEIPEFYFWRTDICNEFFKTTLINSYSRELGQALINDVMNFENNLFEILSKKFYKINQEELYQMDIISVGDVEKVFLDNDKISDKILVVSKYYEIISVSFNLTVFDCNESSVEIQIQKVLDSFNEVKNLLIVPECFGKGYSVHTIDELDIFILEELQAPKSIQKLFHNIVSAFDSIESEDDKNQVRNLIFNRIKENIHNKAITLCN